MVAAVTNQHNTHKQQSTTLIRHQLPTARTNAVTIAPPLHDAMTALHAISSALLSMHDDDPLSDDFQFESEYVKSLLKQQRTPSPIIYKPHLQQQQQPQHQNMSEKENIGERWRTPVTVGATSGRTILAQRDMNIKTGGDGGITEDTPVVKPTYFPSLC
jgi:hypothetical protein